MQKTARKKPKYSRNETIVKIGHLAKCIAFVWAIALANTQIGPKILCCLKPVKIYSVFTWEYFCAKKLNLAQKFKLPKIFQKSILCSYWSNSAQKTARKNTKYSRNETMLNIGHLVKSKAFAWPIAFAKYSLWAKILNCLYILVCKVLYLEICFELAPLRPGNQSSVNGEKPF